MLPVLPPDTMSGGGRPQAAQQIVQSVQRHVPLAPRRKPFSVPGDYHRFPLPVSSSAAAAAAASRGSVGGGDVEEGIVTRTPVSFRFQLTVELYYYRLLVLGGFRTDLVGFYCSSSCIRRNLLCRILAAPFQLSHLGLGV